MTGDISDEHAASAIVRLVKSHKASGTPLSILTLGPLTNLATAIVMDPTIPDNVDKIYISGGAYKSFGNVGSTNPSAEFNFFADPDAARIVYENFAMVNILPLEVGVDFGLT